MPKAEDFRRTIRNVSPDSATVSFKDSRVGDYATIFGLNDSDLNEVASDLDTYGIDHAIVEIDRGPGIEAWIERSVEFER